MKGFRPGQVGAMGPLRFDIDQAIAILTCTPRETVRLDVDSHAKLYGLRPDIEHPDREPVLAPVIDVRHAMGTDLDLPLILGSFILTGGAVFPLILDGMHRLYQASRLGVTWLAAYQLTTDETDAVTGRKIR